MTRETKIGLLVGLAFIIVIGILLSDHVTMTSQPPQAALAEAGPNVRQAVAVPSVSNSAVSPLTPENVTPQQTVLIQQDLHQPQPAPQVNVRVGGSDQPAIAVATPDAAAPAAAISQDNPVQQPAQPYISQLPQNGDQRLPGQVAMDPLQQTARNHGEALIPADNRTNTGTADIHANDRTVSTQEYVVVAGDTLSKLAGRFYGANTKANRDLIVQANPSLKENPNLLIVGRAYLIPSQKITAAVSPSPTQAVAAAAPQQSAQNAAALNSYNYQVQSGDSLWKIATEQLGDAGQVATIKTLNQDLLKGSDVVRVGMTLKLPGRALSRAD